MTFRVLCECGYHVGNLDEPAAIAYATYHEGGTCEPVVESEEA